MTDLTIIVGLVFALFTGLVVAYRVARFRHIAFLDWSLLAMGGMYGAGWALVLAVTSTGNNPFWEPWIIGNSHLFLIHTACAIILAGAVWAGWIVSGSLLSARSTSVFGLVVPLVKRQVESPLKMCAWFMLLLAVLFQIVYSHAYGGLFGILEYSNLIRSGIFRVDNPWSFLKPLTGMAFISSFIFFGLALSARKRPWIGLLLSFIFSLYLLYSWLGRVGFLVYLVTFLLGYLFFRQQYRPLRLLVLGTLAFAFILVGAYYVSAALKLKYTEGLFNYLAKELSFPFASSLGHLGTGDIAYRWFMDLLAIPLYFLPSSLWTGWMTDVSQVNTALIMGAPKGEAGVTAGIPVDLITLGLLQASVPGIVGVGIFFGILIRLLQWLTDRIPHAGVRSVLGAYVGLRIAALGIFKAQPSALIKDHIALIIACGLIIVFLALPRIRWKRLCPRTPTVTATKS